MPRVFCARNLAKTRVTVCACVVLNLVVWIGGLGFQVKFTRADGKFDYDWTNGKATGPLILLMSCESSAQRPISRDQ